MISIIYNSAFASLNNTVYAFATYDDSTFAVRIYQHCTSYSLQEVSAGLRKQQFNCTCINDCFIALRVGYPEVEENLPDNLHLCEISIE